MKKNRIATIVLLLLALVPQLAFARPNVPASSNDFVLDQASVLANDTEAYLSLNAKKLKAATDAEIVFVTVPSTGGAPTGDYALELFNTWQIGGSNNSGVLVLMAIDDDDYWLLQGRGIERNLSSGDLSEMQNKYLEPDFARRDYDAGALKLYDALHKRVADIYGKSVPLLSMSQVRSQIGETGSGYSSNNGGNYSGGSDYGDDYYGEDDFDWGEIVIAIVVVVLILYFAGRSRRNYTNSGWGGGYNNGGWGGGYNNRPSNGSFWWGYLMGRGSGSNSNWNRPRPPRPPSGGGGFGGFGGGGFGGFGGGGGRGGGGFGGGRSGGGSSRGGGSGRGR